MVPVRGVSGQEGLFCHGDPKVSACGAVALEMDGERIEQRAIQIKDQRFRMRHKSSLTSEISRNVNKSNTSNRGRYTFAQLDTDFQNPHGNSAGPCSDFVARLVAAGIRQFKSFHQNRLAARIGFLHSAWSCRAFSLWHL